MNKTKFHLIEPKINWHIENNIGGGICEMTLCYLLYSEKLCDVYNLNNLISINNENCTFDHQLSNDYGFLGDKTYAMTNDGIKELHLIKNKHYLKTVGGNMIRTISIHFQGDKKYYLENL